MPRKLLKGVVVNNTLNKTVTVSVNRNVLHKVYKKFVTKTKKYLAHDDSNSLRIGDSVSIIESRPISKRKKWVIYNEGGKV